jgi:predicted acetyltransferase|tara:strand:+ start:579 stop:1118 length:540 start_codon:yes stop_codon:yes gene_type:complete
MKDRLKIYSTKNLDQNLTNKILKLKSTHWKNNLTSQKKWFKKNLFNNDIHIIIENKKILVGYVALRKRIFYYDNNVKHFNQILLFDTLIIRKQFRGNGYAEKLVKKTIKISDKLETLMILSCRKEILDFYIKLGWKKIYKKNLNVLDDKSLKNFLLIYKKNLSFKNKIFKKKINLYLNR